MTRTYARIASGTTLDPPHGGPIRVGEAPLYPVSEMVGTRQGVAVGPLHLSVPEAGRAEISDLRYLPSDDSLPLLSLAPAAGAAAVGGVATAESDSEGDREATLTTRRAVLGAAAAGLATAALGGPATAQSDDQDGVRLPMAQFGITYLDAPLSLCVLDEMSGVLPRDAGLYVDVDGTRVTEVSPLGEPTVLQQTGDAAVYLEADREAVARLLAWVRGLLPDDKSIGVSGELPQPASAYSGERVALSTHPAVVDPAAAAGADATVVTIGDEQIPHGSGGADRGIWHISDGALVYEAGTSPPDAATWEVRTRLGRLQRFLEEHTT